MVKTWIATDNNGLITAASTNEPTKQTLTGINALPSAGTPDYQHLFDLSWGEIDKLHLYKVVDGQLVLK